MVYIKSTDNGKFGMLSQRHTLINPFIQESLNVIESAVYQIVKFLQTIFQLCF